jgi:hypothetical protein
MNNIHAEEWTAGEILQKQMYQHITALGTLSGWKQHL